MNAGSYKTRMSRLTFVFCVIALCNFETDIYNLNKYAFLATINLHSNRHAVLCLVHFFCQVFNDTLD